MRSGTSQRWIMNMGLTVSVPAEETDQCMRRLIELSLYLGI